MFDRIVRRLESVSPSPVAEAHCDGPCGVYDPASARIAAEAVLSMTKKLLALPVPSA
ncbi:MAG: nickel superoxide dismutase, partial [Myxococcota bacterium]